MTLLAENFFIGVVQITKALCVRKGNWLPCFNSWGGNMAAVWRAFPLWYCIGHSDSCAARSWVFFCTFKIVLLTKVMRLFTVKTRSNYAGGAKIQYPRSWRTLYLP